mgnify:CR=1 FL=1
MPEVRHNFTGGKMNKDLDERLVPNGEYRHALNVEVSTSEGSDVGTVQNILGNKRVDDLVGADFNCVGSIADEKNNKLYWFISKYDKDVILEYDIANDMASPVLVDLKGGTQKAVLKFFGNTITGINIIDDLLFWSDNKGEPKKINIKRCKEGTANVNTHTQLSFSNNSFTGIAVEYTFNAIATDGGYGFDSEYHPPLVPIEKRPKIGRYSFYERRRLAAAVGVDFSAFVDDSGNIKDANGSYIQNDSSNSFDENGASSTGNLSGSPYAGYNFKARHYRDGELLGGKEIRVFDNQNGLHLRYHITSTTPSTEKDFRIGDVIFAENTRLDIEEKHITVIKPKPLKAPSVKINYKEQTKTTNKKPNLFEEQFPRFSYRYKYADGEFSAFAPFTEPVFNPQYTQNTDKSTDGSVLHGKDDIYDIKDPKNKAMVNAIHSVDLMDFITINTPEDVVEVDLLYKKEDSPVIYSIGTVNHTDFEWHASAFNHEHGQSFIGGADRYDDNISYDGNTGAKNWMPAADGGYNSGKYTVKNENIYAALPANQLLRPWDNVPRKALAQEVSGSRIIYGNYLQNYTIGSKPKVFVDYNDRKKTIGTFDTGGLPSIKSQRNYQLGVIYCDEFGRETPVFTSNSAAVNIPWAENDGAKNASKSNQMIASVESNFPDWVDSIKFFVKENSGEYYNLTMERAWTGKSTYELDNSEGHLWMSFPSSDRNKISKEDSIILKKKIGVGEEQISFENKFTVIDIKDEAPDAIKYELVNLGNSANDATNILTVTGAYPRLFTNAGQRPDKLQDTIVLDIVSWNAGGEYRDELIEGIAHENKPSSNLYLSWFRSGGASSSKYKVSGGWRGTGGYVLKLNREITEKDANVAHVNGNSATDTAETHVHQDLIFQVEKRVAKDDENFSGQFFVKISKNHITSIVETGNELSNLDKFQVTADQGVWYWRDDTNYDTQDHAQKPFVFQTGSPYGLTNYFGDTSLHATDNNIQSGGGNNGNTTAEGGTARLTDWHVMWENILGELDNKPRWFVDSMHMASGQSDASDYAKYNCVTWSGSQDYDPGHQYLWPAKSAWGYPPLKKWFTEVTENEINVEGSEGDYFTENNPTGVVSTSNLFDQNAKWLVWDDVSEENVGLQIDGWVGVTQNVSRWTSLDSSGSHHNGTISLNHINGLEGMVTTNEYHTTGPRRWFSGMNGIESGNGEDTKTYSSTGDETEKHFMHLSFFAPGKDLHDNTWHFEIGASALYGKNAWMDNLQGIWGGGVFTGTSKSQKFGADVDAANKHFHLAMEGNYADGEDNNYQVYSTPPGPGSGFGYDLDYRELHERQWDPTFNSENDPENKIRDFIRNLHPGSKFRFNHKKPGVANTTPELDDEVYTIKKVRVKKLYNHTSWRTPHNQYRSGNGGYVWDNLNTVNVAYRSVEDLALGHLNQVNSDGISNASINNSPGDYTTDNVYMLKKKIVDFGAAHNRRVCYVIELNKNPATWGPESSSTMGNPLNSTANGNDGMCGDLDSDNYTHVEFLDPVQDNVLKDLSKFPAIWELSPKKQDVDLDIYYEASNNIPVRINGHTNELFAPKGCLVEMINPPSNHGYSDVHLVEWSGNTATLEPGFNRGDVDGEVDYSGIKFKFIRRDGSYTVAEAGLQQLTAAVSGYKTRFVFKQNISSKIQVGLAWYNCFSFGNGLESNRIQDGFNNMFITNGVKASTTVQETYQEEHRKHGIIYSGLYNSNSGINNLNQFIMAEKITKDLNPTYGSIQKLFSRDTDLIAFCEDKVLRVLANKDAVFNADGNAQLTSNQNVLGQAVPFQGEYGISKNPESFASESYRAYFTDKQRGAVLRLSKDGLTPISKAGMHDWFRDNLSKHTSLVGTYDSYKENYNITLSNTYTENIIFNTYFRLGAESVPLDATVLSSVTGGAPISGSAYEHSWETKNILTNSQYNFNTGGSNAVDPMFKHDITVTNHPAIPIGRFQQAVTASDPTPSPNIAVVSSTGYVDQLDEILDDDAVAFEAEVPFLPAVYDTYYNLPTIQHPFGEVPQWYLHYASGVSMEFGGNAWYTQGLGMVAGSKYKRTFAPGNGFATTITESSTGSEAYLTTPCGLTGITGWAAGNDPSVEKTIHFPIATGTNAMHNLSQANLKKSSGTITKNSDTGYITFDRPHPDVSHVIIEDIGRSNHANNYNINAEGGVNSDYYSSAYPNGTNAATDGIRHNSFYNGDELHIQVELRCYMTFETNGHQPMANYGSNTIAPRITLLDGGTIIPNSKIVMNLADGDSQASNPTDLATGGANSDNDSQYKYWQSQPGEFASQNMNDWTGDIASSSSSSYNEGGYLVAATQATHPTPGIGIQANFTTPRSVPGNYPNGDKIHIKKFASSAEQAFPSTSRMYTEEHTHTLTAASDNAWYNFQGNGQYDMVVGFSIKFRDGNQQSSDGSSNSSMSIVEQKVIDNLQIKIFNLTGPHPSLYPSNVAINNSSGTGVYTLQNNPLWEIKSVKASKGFGITAPHQAFEEEVAAVDATVLQAYYQGVYTEWFDDVETTGVVESLTTADIVAQGGAFVNGNWVLNQSAIDAWNLAYPGGEIFAQDNIPLDDVPAFVEVSHSNGNWQKGAYNMASGHSQWYNTHTSTFFGNNRTAIPDSAYKTNQADGSTGSLVSWYKPGADPAGQSGQEGNYGNTSQFDKTLTDGIGQSFSPPGQAQLPALNGTGSTPVTKTYNDFVVDWWRVGTAGDSSSNTSQAYSVHFPLGTDDELQTGQWYMVDVELKDTFHPNQYDYNNGVPPFTDSYGSGAFVCVKGAGTGSESTGYNYSESGGYGFQTGGSSDRHVVCVPAWRTRYDSGNPRWVLRAIFKLETDSWAYPSNLDKIILRFYYVNPDPWYVNKIICKKVSYKNNTGSATSWSRPGVKNYADHHLQLNTFSESKLYYRSQALCYDEVMQQDNYLNGTSGIFESIWNQEFAAGKEVTNTGSGWILNLKVGKNPKTNLSFSDNTDSKLGIKVTGPIGEYSVTYPDQFTGMIANIEHEGEYQIKFDMSGTFNSDWSIKKGGSDYAATLFDEYGAIPPGTLWANTDDGVGVSNAIGFYNASSSVPLSCSIFDVYLTQTETIFSGGQAGSWGFDGFDSTSEQFITWDIYWPDGQVGTNADGRIQFSNCPLSDPSFGNGNTIISANQYIDKVINRYEKYEISFNFNMQTQNEEGVTIDGQGLFHMYYFNGSGYGFRINDIGDEDFATVVAPNYTKEAIYNQSMIDAGSTLEDAFLWWRVTKIVGIGDGSIYDPATGNGNIISYYLPTSDIWENAYSEFQTQGVEALRDTLVIRKDSSDANDVTGWIDDISMKRVYDVEMTSGPDGIPGNEDDVAVYPETTLTFSEDVKGWTSFKSFIPESGVSLSKKYFTFKDGYLYQHYKPLKLNEDNVHWDDCNYVDAENYNHFYDHLPVSEHNYSEIVAVINIEPNVVKTFNTLSYEGSQAHVTNPGAIALQKPKLINQNNALAWALNDYNATPTLYPNIDGWKCVDIKTDLDDGQLLDFIKKEGKWFGYIRGKHIVGKLDTSRFSVQGLGRIQVDNINP